MHTCTFANSKESGAAHHVIALKDNQKTFHEEMLLLFEKELKASGGLFRKSATVTEKSHGRIEKRTCHQTDYIGWFEDKDAWIGLRSVIMIESERTVWDGFTPSVQVCKCASGQCTETSISTSV